MLELARRRTAVFLDGVALFPFLLLAPSIGPPGTKRPAALHAPGGFAKLNSPGYDICLASSGLVARTVCSEPGDRSNEGIHAMGKDNERGVVYGGWMIQGVALLLVLFARPVAAQEQAVDAALRDRVLQLVERLDDPKPEARDEAQGRLIKLGSKILPLLPEGASVSSKERRERLDKIRAQLRETEQETKTGASTVTIQAKGIRLSDALQQIQRQTGNAITDLREQLGTEVTNPSFDLDIKGQTFHEALDKVASLADVTVNAFSGDGSIGITSGTPPKDPKIKYVGPFRVAFKQLSEQRDLQAGSTAASAQLEVSWEPRLRPMLLTLKVRGRQHQGRQEPGNQAADHDGVERSCAPARESGGRDQPEL